MKATKFQYLFKSIITGIVFLFFLFISCTSDPISYNLGEYYVEIVTALHKDAFLLDTGKTLYAGDNTPGKSFEAGDRVYLTFSYESEGSGRIKVHNASKISSGTLKAVSGTEIEQKASDPIRLESAWIGSHYLNLRFYMEYKSEKHTIALLADESQVSGEEVDLYFLHDKNNDAPGYPTMVYLSYDLSKVLGDPQGDRRLYVHFNTGNYEPKICVYKY